MQTNLQVQWGPKRKMAETVLLRNWKRERERERERMKNGRVKGV